MGQRESASYYNTLQHAATHCTALQHAATRCNTPGREHVTQRPSSGQRESASNQTDTSAPGLVRLEHIYIYGVLQCVCSVAQCVAGRERVDTKYHVSSSFGTPRTYIYRMCCSVCHSVVQCGAVCCGVLQRVCSVLQCVAVKERVDAKCHVSSGFGEPRIYLHTMCCSVCLHCVTVCCTVLQCVAACCSVVLRT